MSPIAEAETQVYVSLEFTPNPNSLKYTVNRTLLSHGAMNFTELADAQARSPLAGRLMEVPGVSGVMIGPHFITITKGDDVDWDTVHEKSRSTIESHLSEALPVLSGEASSAMNAHKGGGSAVEQRIRDILDQEIRPAVAMDGGDITFEKFEDGIVYLYLQGACSGCQSASATLKLGIETRLKDQIPEVKEVVSI